MTQTQANASKRQLLLVSPLALVHLTGPAGRDPLLDAAAVLVLLLVAACWWRLAVPALAVVATGGLAVAAVAGEAGPFERLPSPAAARASPVVVAPGDTLWAIAARHLPPPAAPARVATAWPRWWLANRSVVDDDPHLIRPGQRLRPPT